MIVVRRYVVGSAPLFPLAVVLALGVMAGFAVRMDSVWLLVSLVLLVSFTCVTGRWAVVQSVAICLSVGTLGMFLATRQRMKEESAVRFAEYGGVLEVVIASEPVEKPKTYAFDVVLTGNGRKLKCYVEKDDRSRVLMPGMGLVMQTVVRPLQPYRLGRFDYRQYLVRHGFSGQCFVKSHVWQTRSVSVSRLPWLQRVRIQFLHWRHQLLSRYRQLGAHDDSYAVLAAMTLGDKSALSRDLRDVYSVTGASHVLALSGLHLGILYFVLSWVLLGRWRPSVLSQSLLVAGIWSFAFLVGLPVSVIRSALMLTVFAVFSLGGRSGASLNTLSFAAILLLLASPDVLYDVGFQLSFVAVMSILLLMPVFDGWAGKSRLWRHWLVRPLWGVLAVSVAAQAGVAPLIAYHFGRFSTYFLLTNVVVLPCAYLILLGSLLMLLLPWGLLASGVLGVVDFLNRVLDLIASLPLASIEGICLSVFQLVVCYLMLFALYGALLRLSNLRLWP